MRSFGLAALCALAIDGVATLAAPVRSVSGVAPAITPPPGSTVLYQQLDDASGSAFLVGEFEEGYDGYDCEGGDDFHVLDPVGWDLTAVGSPGRWGPWQGQPPKRVNLFFYEDAGGLPGAVLEGCAFPSHSQFSYDVLPPDGGWGKPVELEVDVSGCHVPAGAHWFSQQVRQFVEDNGAHYWSTRNSASGYPAVWRNPPDGWDTGCVDWTPAHLCGMQGQDYLFYLTGTLHTPHGSNPDPDPDPVPAVGPLGVALLVLMLGSAAGALRRRGG